jgi:putative ABC transport system permease protein
MRLEDSVEIALTNIMHQKLRSWLTILGIVVGVAAIITLISISMGMQANVAKQTSSLGANQITVTAGSTRAGRMMGMGLAGGGGGPPPGGAFGEEGSSDAVITFKEAEDLSSITGVSVIDARLQKRTNIVYKAKNTTLSVIGTNPDAFPETLTVKLESGRLLGVSDKYDAVIGYNVAHSVFDGGEDNGEDMLNNQIEIGGVAFKVVGILNESGSMGGGDSSIYIPIETAQDLFDEDEDASEFIIVTKSGYDVDTVATAVKTELKSLHDLSDDQDADFQVVTAATMQSAVSSITSTLTLFLGGIASISLIVGGIGVLNTMFMSVLEQTKTIGVFKALGAKDRDIVRLFLIEAATLGFIGGAAGVGLSFFASIVLSMFNLPSAITPGLVAVGLFFSVIVGIVAGIVPARNAAQISPIEALRYE